MDASEYDKGKGKIKLRAKIEIRDPKTIVITEICYGTTTESFIRSIDEAAKKGKIKIDSINDYTSENVEIEIKLPRGQYAQDLIDALYAYTECEVSFIHKSIVIKDNYPWETTVDEILHFHIDKLQYYLRRELEIERDHLNEKIFEKSLEQIFIENRLYKTIEKVETYEAVHATIAKSLKPFHPTLLREPTHDDRERLLKIPIRRISLFDLRKNEEDIIAFQAQLAQVEKDLKNIKKVAIKYLNNLLKKYSTHFPRRTEVQAIEQIDLKAIETRQVTVGFDPVTGFIGTKVSSPHTISCTNFDKLLVLYKDGSYVVINIPEKEYLVHEGSKVIFVGVADKKTVISAVYKDPKTHFCYAKRFVVDKFILDKVYRYLDENMTLEFLATTPNNKVEMQFIPKVKQKIAKAVFDLDSVAVKGVASKGIRMATRGIKKIVPITELGNG